MADRGGRWRAYGVAGGVFAVDRLSKWLVETRLGAWETHAVIPGFFNLIRTENRGAAFSLLAAVDTEWRRGLLIVLSAAAAVVISVLLWRAGTRAETSGALRFSLALILGGALGNLCDRAFRGAVTDFLELYAGDFRWPAFNVADAAITIGAALALWDMWRSRRAAPRT
jgi:signal peptidase II